MPQVQSQQSYKEVASFPDKQITGVGVSTQSGRIFVNFPYWSDNHVRYCFADREHAAVQ
jgi:hypothetical protein